MPSVTPPPTPLVPSCLQTFSEPMPSVVGGSTSQPVIQDPSTYRDLPQPHSSQTVPLGHSPACLPPTWFPSPHYLTQTGGTPHACEPLQAPSTAIVLEGGGWREEDGGWRMGEEQGEQTTCHHATYLPNFFYSLKREERHDLACLVCPRQWRQ